MLVLSRKVGERVVIGTGIVVVVKRVSGQRVTFGIEAPVDVKIIRGELEVFDTPGPASAAGQASPVTPFIPTTDATSSVSAKPR